MKKKLLLAAAGTTLLAAAALAASNSNDAGCGVGSLIFKDNTAVQQVLAATTNGTFGNQTFGITTGTLGCTASGNLQHTSQAQQNFVAANYRNLSREMAAGQGEYLSSLSGMLGCDQASATAVGKLTQSNYPALFPSKDATPEQLLGTLKTEMKADPKLSSSCTLL
jgi:hypothetical protein